MLAERVRDISAENDDLSAKLAEIQQRENLAVQKESQTRKMSLEMQLKVVVVIVAIC